jgi:hypothetical protein
MKTILSALILIIACGCTSHNSPKYTALIRDKSVRSELVILESQRIPSVRFAEVTLARVCATLSSYDREPEEFQNSAILDSASPEFGDRIVNLEMKNATLAELYDRICESTDAIWWVDHHIHIAPKTP